MILLIGIVLLALAVFLWAQDPFVRLRFSIQTPIGAVDAIGLIPKMSRVAPAVIVMPRQHENALLVGNKLRTIAALGMVAIAVDASNLDETGVSNIMEQVVATTDRMPWLRDHRIALLKRPELTYRTSESITAKVKVVAVPDRHPRSTIEEATLFRIAAEKCLTELNGKDAFNTFHSPLILSDSDTFRLRLSVLLGILFVTVGSWGKLYAACCRAIRNENQILLSVGTVSALLAVGQLCVHAVLPQMPVSKHGIDLCRRFLVPNKHLNEFDTLAIVPIWKGHRLQELLTHAELSSYTVNELANWTVDKAIYKDFVLSPIIDRSVNENRVLELNWRRTLWEYFYPCVRKEHSSTDAAIIVINLLRSNVTSVPGYQNQRGVRSTWDNKIGNPADFERLYVAALRSVGVAARLNDKLHAELWDNGWMQAPRAIGNTDSQ